MPQEAAKVEQALPCERSWAFEVDDASRSGWPGDAEPPEGPLEPLTPVWNSDDLASVPRCRTPRNFVVPLPENLASPSHSPPAFKGPARPRLVSRPPLLQPVPISPPPTSPGDLWLAFVHRVSPQLHLHAGAPGLRWLEDYLGKKLPYAPLGRAAVDFAIVDLDAFSRDLERAAAQVVNAAPDPAAAAVGGPADDVELLCHARLAHDLLCDFERAALRRGADAKDLRRMLGHQSVARRTWLAQLQPSEPQTVLDLMRCGQADWRRDVLQLTQPSAMDAIYAAVCGSCGLEVRAWGLPVALSPARRTQRVLFVDNFDHQRLHLRLAWVHGGGASCPTLGGADPGEARSRAADLPEADDVPRVDVPGRGLLALGLRIERPFGLAGGPATVLVTEVWLGCDAVLDGAPVDPPRSLPPRRRRTPR